MMEPTADELNQIAHDFRISEWEIDLHRDFLLIKTRHGKEISREVFTNREFFVGFLRGPFPTFMVTFAPGEEYIIRAIPKPREGNE